MQYTTMQYTTVQYTTLLLQQTVLTSLQSQRLPGYNIRHCAHDDRAGGRVQSDADGHANEGFRHCESQLLHPGCA